LGTFSAYGDAKVRRRISSVIYEPRGFLSLLTELSFAAWNLSKGFAVTPYEHEGYPDFRVEMNDMDFPVVADCKRVSRESGVMRYKKIVDKANRQIKALGEECYGLVVVDIAERVPNALAFTIPGAVRSAVSSVHSALRNYNTSVSAALLHWDEYLFSGGPTRSPSSLCALQRRSLVVEHANPKHALPDDLPMREYAYTVDFPISWTPRL